MQYFKKLERDRRSTAFKSRLSPKWKCKGTKHLTELSALQNKNDTLQTEETTKKRKELWQTFQEKHLDLKESFIWQISDERTKLQDHLLCGEQKPSGLGSTAHTDGHDKVLWYCMITSSHTTPSSLGGKFLVFSDFSTYWKFVRNGTPEMPYLVKSSSNSL